MNVMWTRAAPALLASTVLVIGAAAIVTDSSPRVEAQMARGLYAIIRAQPAPETLTMIPEEFRWATSEEEALALFLAPPTRPVSKPPMRASVYRRADYFAVATNWTGGRKRIPPLPRDQVWAWRYDRAEFVAVAAPPSTP